MTRWSLVVSLFILYFLVSCGSSAPEIEVLESENGSLGLTLKMNESLPYTGWLYSYGINWIPCKTEHGWNFPALIRSAWAGHPIRYTEPGDWEWHQPIPIGAAQTFHLEGIAQHRSYCGLHWTFAHGGVPIEGILSSLEIERDGVVLATSHHAWTLDVTFDSPVCPDENGAHVVLQLQTKPWLEDSVHGNSPTRSAQLASMKLGTFLSIEQSLCELGVP